MKQEENDLLLKDICARLPYELYFKMEVDGKSTNKILTPEWISAIKYHPQYFKPYLRPMSSMTEEEAKEIAILHDIKDILSVKVTSDYIDVIVDDGVCSTETRTIWYDEIVSSIKCFDWLNKKMFDYRGLISYGLALEAPESMYNV